MVFHRFESDSITRVVDDRFEYFTNKVMPDFKKDLMYHTMIFVPSYFDYVRVRNWCNGADLDFTEVCEYTKDKKIAEARDLFFHSDKHFLLYTERCHFYRRFAIKGIRHLIFYQLPAYPKFFAEMCNLMQNAFQNRKGGSDGNMSCTVIYNKFDVQRLAPVVTTERAHVMLQAESNVHMFVPGQSS
jgi:U3 small nucleolar RNA-associated protein 25